MAKKGDKPEVIVKIKNIAKKITSLLLMSVGLSFLTDGVSSALLIHYIISSSTELDPLPNMFRGPSLGYIFIGILLIALASFSWGWKKNWKIFGIFICFAGFNFMLQSFYMLSNPPLKDYSPFNKIFPTSILAGFISSAILFIVIGLLIFMRTKRNRDNKNKNEQQF